MASTNMSSIMNKVNLYAKSKEGKERIGTVLKQYREKGKSHTDAGSEVLTRARMAELAVELISILKTTAASYDLAESVMQHFETLDYMFQDLDDGKFECFIYFNDDLSRDSLETDYNQGEGINNIIALFNNGYVASSPKYGWWNGHAPTGEAGYRSGTISNDAYIKGTQGRPSLRFMQTAIEEFYSRYAQRYAMTVVLNDDYDGHYGGSSNGIISTL